MTQILKAIVLIAAGLAVAVWSVPQQTTSDGYPRKPITLVVAYSPGGAVDTVARTVGKRLEQYLGQRIVVQNKPGAGGEIGYRSLARARADGYTIGMITSPPILMLDKLRPDSGVQMSEFEAVASLQKDPVVLAINSNSPYRTLGELLEAASRQTISVAGDGPNSNNQLQLALAEKMLGVDFNFVPYNGSGPSITSLLGNQVDAAVPSASSATTYAKRGDLRVLAVFAAQRYQYLPDVPTILEAAGADIPEIGAAVRGIVVPKGVPAKRRAVLVDAIGKVMQDPDFLEHAVQTRLPLHYLDASDFDDYLRQAETLLDAHLGLLSAPGGSE